MMTRRPALPGHMARAERVLKEHLRLVDVVWEIVDARAPWSSRNPRLDRIVGQKACILVLNKADLAAEDATALWRAWWRQRGRMTQPLSATRGLGLESLLELTQDLAGTHRHRPLRALVAGIPNVGKSSLLNRVAGHNRARTGARPGITRGEQWLRLQGIELLDLPGILPPQIRGEEQAAILTVIDAVTAEAASDEEAALWLIAYLTREMPRTLERVYEVDETRQPPAVLEQIAVRRGALRAGAQPDAARAAALLLKDFRAARLGRITLERPPQTSSEAEREDE